MYFKANIKLSIKIGCWISSKQTCSNIIDQGRIVKVLASANLMKNPIHTIPEFFTSVLFGTSVHHVLNGALSQGYIFRIQAF